jgi:hypothetical protein
MKEDKERISELSERLFEFVSGLLEEEYQYQEICMALASHAARLGLQNDPEPISVVGNLFLPVVHQLMDESNYDEGEELQDPRITHQCRTLQ